MNNSAESGWGALTDTGAPRGLNGTTFTGSRATGVPQIAAG